jgi:hypothetical protein
VAGSTYSNETLAKMAAAPNALALEGSGGDMETVITLARLYAHSLSCPNCRLKFWTYLHLRFTAFVRRRIENAKSQGGKL